MANKQIIIIGCGIAGPVLAVFLKRKGYEPVVFERQDQVNDVGISLMLQPNGLKVLSLIPGLLEELVGGKVNRFAYYSNISHDMLGETPTTELPERYGFGMTGVSRPLFHHLLVQTAEKDGVTIHWGHQLSSLQQFSDHVEVKFTNGVVDTASFVIGCDGLHSTTRTCLFGQEPTTFTGLVQTGGVAPTPAVLAENPGITEIFDFNMHMITYPINATHSSWAITSAEPEAKESWRAIDDKKQNEFKAGPCGKWEFGGGELVQHSEKITKYGLYERPELKTWYHDRVVLLGDAGHPTTPHLGQGANQAFEDVYIFIRTLVKHHPDPTASFETGVLGTIFSEYEKIRLPRSSMLVQGAKARGGERVANDLETAKKRDETLRMRMADSEPVTIHYDTIASGPYSGTPEI